MKKKHFEVCFIKEFTYYEYVDAENDLQAEEIALERFKKYDDVLSKAQEGRWELVDTIERD